MSVRYVEKIESRLLQGAKLLPQKFIETQRNFVLSQLHAKGGFAGRLGGVDPYYTAFGLRTADLLEIKGEFWKQNGELFFSWQGKIQHIVECYSMLVQLRVIERNLQRDDGLSLKEASLTFIQSLTDWQGIYQEFLIMLCLGMVGEDTPQRYADELLLELHRDKGGFSQTEVENAGLNPTAAAVALLSAKDAVPSDVKEKTALYLSSLQGDNGGFLAHEEAPETDLLSTFTALVAAMDLGSLAQLRLGDIGRFIKTLQASGGGFRATQKDNEVDLEYTFYGIGTLALLAHIVKEKKGNKQ